MSDLLESALRYASYGWPVFPAHSIVEGKCTCGKECRSPGKHPKLRNGFKSATIKPETIKSWWAVWPNANIGVTTGKESGLVVLDLDEGADLPINYNDIPETLETITGSGGRHILFKYPDGLKDDLLSKSGVWTKVDSRAKGGYFIAPPSVHPSGRTYEWESSGDPEEGATLADCPDWFTSKIKKKEVVLTENDQDFFLPYDIEDTLEAIPADNYDDWVGVGQSLQACGADFELWDNWSKKSEKYTNSDDLKPKWNSFQVYDGIKRGVGYLYQLAENNGWIDQKIKHGAKIGSNIKEAWINRNKREIKEIVTEKATKPDLVPDAPLINLLMSEILKTSLYEQPDLALGASICFLGALFGRRVQAETGARTNFYVVGLAESGSGKDHARKIVNKLAFDAQIKSYLGGDRIASEQGLLTSLEKHASKVFNLDEFGLLLKSITGANADNHKKGIITSIMQLYSSASGVFMGTEYANQKERERVEMVEPHLCIYGVSTHSHFYEALSSSEAVDGTLSRFLIVDAGKGRPKMNRNAKQYNPEAHELQLLSEIANGSYLASGLGNIAKSHYCSNNHINQGTFTPITFRFESDELRREFQDFSESVYDNATDEMSRSIYSRVGENALKLALLYACCSDSPDDHKITKKAWDWGVKFSMHSANYLINTSRENVADNLYEKNLKRIEKIIRLTGNKGISHSVLYKKLRNIPSAMLKENMQRLYESDVIDSETSKGKGRPTITYFWKG